MQFIHGLQQTLIDTLPQTKSVEICFGKTLADIESRNGEAYCIFRDGTTSGPFDVVVGCDGIKSSVKEFIEKGKISDGDVSREGKTGGLYSGIRISYAVKDCTDNDDIDDSLQVQQAFANGAYLFSGSFGNGSGRPPCKCTFITSLDDRFNGPFRRKDMETAQSVSENIDWRQDNRVTKDEAKAKMMQSLSKCGIQETEFRSDIDGSDRYFDLGVYFHSPLSLSGWSKEIPGTDGSFAVICGDAAHAMPPFLGQGANQAIQDAFTLAEAIRLFNQEVDGSIGVVDELETKSLKQHLKAYENIRWSPTASITVKAAIIGYLETGGRDGFYAKFRDVFFRILGLLGIPARVVMAAAVPKV